MAEAEEEEEEELLMKALESPVLSIYRASRRIKKRDNSLYNALRSIYQDSLFVSEIASLWPQLPLVANLRCGLWYSSKFDSTCYFKSTDGHAGNWSFSTARLNLHLALLAVEKGGCIIVDSTRKGKRFPDSMSKTIPIWTCVLNRAIRNLVSRRHQSKQKEPSESSEVSSDVKQPSEDWDCSLHLPLWVSDTEKATIEKFLDEWTSTLEASGADLNSLACSLKKPLRPLWISQRTVIWLNEVPDYDSWNFTPIILVSASSSGGRSLQLRSTSEFSWHYIAGAGDDEESWARGLTPSLFWKSAYDLIDSGPDCCNGKVAEIVEKHRVYCSQRGVHTVQLKLQKHNSPTDKNSTHDGKFGTSCMIESLQTLHIEEPTVSTERERKIYWLGSTNLAVGTSQHAALKIEDADSILNCDVQDSVASNLNEGSYVHLPILTSKFDRFSLLNNLPAAVSFAKLNLSEGKKVLVCCKDGEDISICVCLAILTCLFDAQGVFDNGEAFGDAVITKWDLRRRLVFICKYAINARPSRGNLRQIFNFLIRAKSLS